MAILDLQTYKDYKNITSPDYDTKLNSLISAANSFIINYCNRSFVDYYSSDKVEYHDGTLSAYLYPEEYPIISVTTVEVSDDGGITYDALTEVTDYMVDYENDRIVASVGDYFVATIYGTRSLKLTYKAGYSAYPEEIVQAAVSLVEYFDKEDYTPRKSLAGASKDSVIIPDKTARLPPHIRRVLEMHRNVVL